MTTGSGHGGANGGACWCERRPTPAAPEPVPETAERRRLLREALAAHHLVGNEPPFRMGGWTCSCGVGCGNGWEGYADHLADVATAPLVARLAREQAAEAEAERDRLQEFAEWVISIADDSPHRRTVTLEEIIQRAAVALDPDLPGGAR